MTKREKNLLLILLIVILFCAFYFSFSYCIDKATNAESRIEKYETAINRLKESVTVSKNETIKVKEIQPTVTINQAVTSFLSDLGQYGISTSRYQISSESSSPSADISFSCTAYSFMNYLYHEYSKSHDYHLTYLHVTQNNDDISVNIHIENLPSEPILTQSDYIQLPDSVRRVFFTPIIQKKTELVVADETPEPETLRGNSLFEIIGNIYTDDTKYLYLKSKSSNRVIKLSPQQIISEDADKLIIELEGERYEISK